MNKHEQLVHSSFPKPNKKATPAYKGPVPNIEPMPTADTIQPMMNPQSPAEY